MANDSSLDELALFEQRRRRQLLAALDGVDVTVGELWLYYYGIGGTASESEVDAYLRDSHALPQLQGDMLAHAVHEMIVDMPPSSASG